MTLTKNKEIVLDSDKQLENAKQCALIYCNGQIGELELFNYKLTPLLAERIRFWQGVKQEITKL